MTPEALRKLLEGTATPEERRALEAQLAQPDTASTKALEEAWAPPPGPDVFSAAFAQAHPRRSWWRWGLPGLAALATALLLVWVTRQGPTEPPGVKGPQAAPELSLVLVVLDAPTHRLAAQEPVPVGARLGCRAVSSQPAWVALEELRGDAWVRLWPKAAAGARVEAGERELSDAAGAVVLIPEEGRAVWPVRLIGALQPLDEPGATGATRVDVQVAR